MDFVSDALFDGRKLRALAVVDAFTREALAIDVEPSIKGEQVVETMSCITAKRGAPKTIRVDNGPEFISKAPDLWDCANSVTLDFSRPGKSTDDAGSKIETWRRDYNEVCPHRSLGWMRYGGHVRS
jgi:putative transposase